MPTFPRSTAIFATALVALAHGAHAGPNAGFTVSVDGIAHVDNPEVGQMVQLPVRAEGTVLVKNTKLRVLYDPQIVEYTGFRDGTLIPGAPGFPDVSAEENRPDGLSEVGYGNAVLFGDAAQVTSGSMGTFEFRVIAPLPEAGSGIWVLIAQIGSSSQESDTDLLTFEPEQLGLALVRRYANRVLNLDVTRAFDGASFAWESRLSGLADTVRTRAVGDSLWQASSSRPEDIRPVLVTAAQSLLASGVAATNLDSRALDSTLVAAGQAPPISGALRDSLVNLDNRLRSRRHVVNVSGLEAGAQYEYEVRSTSLSGENSDRLTGTFRTRLEPDLRPATGNDLDVQATRTSVSATWYTNRPADTHLLVIDSLGAEIVSLSLDPLGSLVHAASASGLLPATRYDYTVTSRAVGADDFVASGQLTESQLTVVKTGSFRTRATATPLRLLGPPHRVVSPRSAVISFELNQIAVATVAYGEVLASGWTSPLYTEAIRTGDILNRHSVTLSDLVPSTRYRYQITVVTPDVDSLSTDPRGNQQWSQDLTFTTSAAGDTLPPVIVEGPTVSVRDKVAIVQFVTDVDTRATVFFGTRGGTYGTADEFDVDDRTADGNLRLTQDHSVTISGLQPGQAYDYGIIAHATNGQTASFEPNLPAGKPARAGKRLKALQPPGGAGSFTTSNDPDTQYPVIIDGPAVSSKSHSTAVLEWTTDEPATSQVDFGVEAIGQARQSSGVSRTRHKVVLTNLAPDSRYLYQVGSTDAAGNGATLSSEALFTTDPEIDLTAPGFTSDPEISYATDEAVAIHWSTSEDATAEVAFGTAAGDLDFVRTSSSTGREHSITLANLDASTTYYYQASSSDLSNNGPTLSDVLSFTTDAATDTTAPVLGEVAIAPSDSAAILAWTTDELSDSFVDLGTVSGILDVTVGDAEDVTEHEVVLTNLSPGQTYYFTVGSSDRAGNGPRRSQELTLTTLDSADATPPATPSDLTGLAGSRLAALSWTAGVELDLAGYNLYRRDADGGDFALVASRLTEPSYTDLGLTNDVAYEYRVTAIDRSRFPNESEPSAAVSFTPTLAAAPTAPTSLGVGGLDLQPTFTFTNAQPFKLGAALTYTVQVSTQPDFSDVTAASSGIRGGNGTTSWTIGRTLENGATYYWRARAVEGVLIGPFSQAQEFLANTGPAVPGDFDDSGAVDLVDFFLFADAYNHPADDYPYYDMDFSGAGTTIDLVDFFVFADAYGTGAGKEARLASVEAPVDDALTLHLTVSGGPLGAADLPRDVVRLRVDAEQARALNAWGLVLSWDPAALTFTDARRDDGGLLAAGDDGAGLFHVLTQRPGRLVLADARSGGAVSGAGELARLLFRVRDRQLASGTALRVEEALVSGGAGDLRRVDTVAPAWLRPGIFALGAAYPNPFNPSTSIDFALPTATTARLTVYDVLGRRVRTLLRADEPLAAGFYAVTWDGRDDAGRVVGNGLYFYRLRTPAATRSGKMMMLK